jgi:hypothetical protein
MLDSDQLRDVWERVLPRPEPVTLRSRLAGNLQSTFAEYALPRAKRKRLTEEQIAARAGTYLASNWRVWQIWNESIDLATALPPATLPCPLPKVADQIRDSEGVVWTVDDVEIKLMGEVINMVCVKQVGD